MTIRWTVDGAGARLLAATTSPSTLQVAERGNQRRCAMDLVTGQVVWVAFATGSSQGGGPMATVARGVVLDGENRVVRRDGGYVGVVQRWSVEQCHATEADAWAANAAVLERHLVEVTEKATECRMQAAKCAAKAAIEVAA